MCVRLGCNVKNHGCADLETLVIHNENGKGKNPDELKVDLLKYFQKLKIYVCFVAYEFDMKVKPNFVSSVEELRLDNSFRYEDKIDFNVKLFPKMFPNLKLLNAPMKCKQIKNLKYCLKLDQILLREHIDDVHGSKASIPHLLQHHPNAINFKHISFSQKLVESELLAIAKYCPNIEHVDLNISESFKTSKLKGIDECFKKLKHVHIYLDNNGSSKSTDNVKLLNFLLVPAQEIITLNIEISREAEDENKTFPFEMYLHELLNKNPLKELASLWLNDVNKIFISIKTMKMISDLPKIEEIIIEGEDGDQSFKREYVDELKSYAASRNYDVIYDIPISDDKNDNDDEAASDYNDDL